MKNLISIKIILAIKAIKDRSSMIAITVTIIAIIIIVNFNFSKFIVMMWNIIFIRATKI